MMLEIAICDDDQLFVNETLIPCLKNAINTAGKPSKIKSFSNGLALLNEIKNGAVYDIVLLDIDMPDINGKDLSRELRRTDNSFFLVFISAYKEEVFDVMKYNINAFIPKTYSQDFYKTELVRIITEYSSCNKRLEVLEVVSVGTLALLKIPLSNILGFMLKRHNITAITSKGSYILKETVFSKISDRFVPLGFFECSRNYLVNISRISEIRQDQLTLQNGLIMPISRRNHKALVSVFNQHIISEV